MNHASTAPPTPAMRNKLLKAEKSLKQQQFTQARKLYLEVVKKEEQSFEAFFGLGIAHLQLGEPGEAITRLQQAVMLNPRHASSHYHLGLALERSERVEEAVKSYIRACKLNPKWETPFSRACRLQVMQNRMTEALPFAVHLCLLQPQNEGFWNQYQRITRNMQQFYEVEKQLDPALKQALQHGITNATRSAVMRQMHFSEWMRPLTQLGRIDDYEELRLAIDPVVSEESFLQKLQTSRLMDLMHRTTITQPSFELILTQIRRYLLLEADTPQRQRLQPLLLALWALSFNNEYVFLITEEERNALPALRDSLAQALSDGNDPDITELALLGSYTPLADEPFAPALAEWQASDATVRHCLKEQVIDRLEERQRMQSLPMLEEIEDETSQRVRAQYEAAPYPRWREIPPYDPLTIEKYIGRFGADLSLLAPLPKRAKEVLIAGCGTGQHPIMLASTLTRCNLLAVDISLASLAYAQRKAGEYKLENLRFMQADILALETLGQSFDMIESVGVLHHMRDPMAGWKVLTRLLKPGGMMRIGLYSRIARKAIIAARQEIAQAGIGDSDDDIRRFRQELMAREYNFTRGRNYEDALTPLINQLFRATDFFALSECRDLIFHVQEHQFTIPQLAECVEELGLEFKGFNLMRSPALEAYEKTLPTPGEKGYFEGWHHYEQQHPETFHGMYQFWLQKPV